MVVSVAFFSLVGVWAAFRVLPAVAVAVSVLMSLTAFALYRADKSAAIQGARRTPERILQAVSLFGGWPRGSDRPRIFRHNPRKQPFQTHFWLTVVANCSVLTWMAIGQPIPF